MPSEEPLVLLDRERYGLPARRSNVAVRSVIRASWARCQHWGLPIEDRYLGDVEAAKAAAEAVARQAG